MTILPTTQIEKLNDRLEKARELVDQGMVSPVLGRDGYYVVRVQEGVYLINGECTCPDARYRAELHKGWCKHRLAVSLYQEAREKAQGSAQPNEAGEDLADMPYGPEI